MVSTSSINKCGVKNLALVISNVVKKFGEKTAVDGISFTMENPGVFGLLGTNGAGKTTTIRMILGILEKDSGTIQWNGKPVTRENVKFGYLPEERGLYPKAKVREQLLYFAKLRGLTAKAAKNSMEQWCERLGVTEYINSVAEHLSKGNQQKIQFISALIHDPELIILDEPLSGLDPINADLFRGVINELASKQKFIIMSSHQMHLVEEYCNDILILKNGKTLLKGNLNEIKRGYGRTNLSIKCEADIKNLVEQAGINIVSADESGYELKIKSEEQANEILKNIIDNGISVLKFEIREPSLHEIFVEKVGGAE